MREIKQYKQYFFVSRILIYVACSKKVVFMLPLLVTSLNCPSPCSLQYLEHLQD